MKRLYVHKLLSKRKIGTNSILLLDPQSVAQCAKVMVVGLSSSQAENFVLGKNQLLDEGQ